MVVGDVTTAVDVVVLGAGPGGYVAAIRAAQLGKSVVLVDPALVPGGTCLNSGCIPLKALCSASERYSQSRDTEALANMGIQSGPVALNFGKMQEWKQGVVNRLTDGVKRLLAGHHIELVHGPGWFLSPTEMRVEGEYGAHRFSFDSCVLAVGASPIALPGLAFDGAKVMTPAQAMALSELPSVLAIYGQDYIALELATVFARLGVAIILLTPGERPLPEVDATAVRLALAGFRKLGIQVINNASLQGFKGESLVYLSKSGKAEKLNPGIPVVVTGAVQANTSRLNLSGAGLVAGEQGAIEVGPDQRTKVSHILAAGDCTQHRPALATSAIKQAKVAAEVLAGRKVAYQPQALPQVIHTTPEIAFVGLSAEAAQAEGYRVQTGRFTLAANGRALTLGADAGTAMVVADADNGAVLGLTIVGPRAGDLISEAALAIEMGATLVDLAETLHPHPGLSELLLESAESALGQAIHQLELKTAGAR